MEDDAKIDACSEIERKGDDGDTVKESGSETSVESTLLSHVPNGHSFENIPEASSPKASCSHDYLDTPVGHCLLFRHNRGKPPARYSLNVETKGSKNPITNHVTSQRLSEPFKAFAHNLSSCHIPCGIHKALEDPKWSQAIQEEMQAL